MFLMIKLNILKRWIKFSLRRNAWNRRLEKPNTTDVDYDYDRHLIEVHNLISKAQLPIELTKDSKYFRGYTVLNKR